MKMRPTPTKKQSRQHVLLRLIKEHQVRTQDDIKRALTQYGFAVTQSSLSRDIAELGLIKQGGVYSVPPRPPQVTTQPIISVEPAGNNLLIVKTLAGMAAPVGITIDENKIANIVGTVSGDDTVFIAVNPRASHETISKSIQKLFKN